MVKLGKCFAALSVSLVFGSSSAAPSVSATNDYRAAAASALRVASVHKQAGQTADACAALAQSLESYRKAVQQETGEREPAASSIHDDSDGMAQVRAQFGCKR